MKKTKVQNFLLTDEETFEGDFTLIAIYSDEEAYRMAFLLNQYLKKRFTSTPAMVSTINHAEFSVFEFEDATTNQHWQLLFNHSIIKQEVISNFDLFSNTIQVFEKKVYYINELKKVRFLLKIIADEDSTYYNDIVKNILTIPQVYTAEILPLAKIKEVKLLLF
jgi:hypothetical protein